MKFLVCLLAVGLIAAPSVASAHGGHHASSHRSSSSSARISGSGRESRSIEHVQGYVTKRGTYVKGYDRTTKDNTKLNNWSTKGNVNPETGKPGEKPPQ